MKKLAFALAATLATAGVSVAETVEVKDADGNGTFSLAEVQAAYPSATEEAFKTADTDASGELSADELAKAVEAKAFDAK